VRGGSYFSLPRGGKESRSHHQCYSAHHLPISGVVTGHCSHYSPQNRVTKDSFIQLLATCAAVGSARQTDCYFAVGLSGYAKPACAPPYVPRKGMRATCDTDRLSGLREWNTGKQGRRRRLEARVPTRACGDWGQTQWQAADLPHDRGLRRGNARTRGSAKNSGALPGTSKAVPACTSD
jgi:hypothetical protein